MRILVSGGAGFIGSNIVEALIERGDDVIVIDDLSTGKRENVPSGVALIENDINNLKSEHLPEIDAVFHTAAKARIQPSIDEPYPFNYANVSGTLAALEIARHNKAKFVYSASSSCYGDAKSFPTREDSKINLETPYAMQKHMGEMYCELYRKLYGMNVTVLRYFNVYGENQILEGAYAAVVGIFLQKRVDGEMFPVFGDGEQRRDFTYVKDVVKANLKALKAENGTYNIGSGENISVNDLVKMIGGRANYLPKRINEARITLANNSLAKEGLGWSPTTSINDWIKTQL